MQRAASLSYVAVSCPEARRHYAMHNPTSFKCQQGQPLTLVFSVGEIQLHWSDSWLTAVTVIRLGRNWREIQIKLAAQIFLRALVGNNSVPLFVKIKVMVMGVLSFSQCFKYFYWE